MRTDTDMIVYNAGVITSFSLLGCLGVYGCFSGALQHIGTTAICVFVVWWHYRNLRKILKRK
ncbi:MAG: hypothetical protein LBV72_14700 [Tannerella sp.]|jgi:hypothetical protein|nr:hypothetical protein [Tannerella sp.]